jgi:hypothetical protein
MAAVTHDARLRQRDITVAEIERFCAGLPLTYSVEAAQWDRMA